MATTIYNHATVTYTYDDTTGQATSNVATATLLDVLTVDKQAIQTAYQLNQYLTYSFSIENTSAGLMVDVVAVDNLGTYTIPGPVQVTPLTYIGPAALYINGVFDSYITATPGAHNVTFDVGDIAVGETATVVYIVQVNAYAGMELETVILNTVTVDADDLAEEITATHSLPVADFAQVTITKDMSPDPVYDGQTLTYTFNLYNYGNTAASNVVLTDTFDPAPPTITVRVNGVVVAATNYTYSGGTLTLPTGILYTLTVPPATYVQDPITGLVTVTPGHTLVTVAGVI